MFCNMLYKMHDCNLATFVTTFGIKCCRLQNNARFGYILKVNKS
jgi:hypothetical protein